MSLVREIKRVHRIETSEIQIVGRAAACFDEELVEQELHHQERRPQVEAILAEAEFCIAAADNILLLEDLNTKAALRKKHGSGKSTGPGTYDNDVSFFIAWIKAHSPTIGSPGEVPVGVELSDWNDLSHTQGIGLSLPIS